MIAAGIVLYLHNPKFLRAAALAGGAGARRPRRDHLPRLNRAAPRSHLTRTATTEWMETSLQRVRGLLRDRRKQFLCQRGSAQANGLRVRDAFDVTPGHDTSQSIWCPEEMLEESPGSLGNDA